MARFNVLLEWDEDAQVWVSHVPSLDWLSTFGVTREEAMANTREAIVGYLEAAGKEGIEIPPSNDQAELATVEVVVP